ncbi:DUF397 domain-containing protein [Streptomyces sp. V2]|uniref:DUF397 domain-containing protein n=1 Tax=Streptomyces niveiscabiei TaxID=164115 RepID=A0ABW9HIV3_9ACTN|nr:MULTISPECIES: DUF397 domain-containing protein [Streptomyces]PWG13114.1 DUF397 domain-containing protein [Streptomyces sp. V2]
MIRKSTAGDSSELAWFKSSYSDSNNPDDCVEVALTWFKSSYSDTSNPNDCVEVANTPSTIHIRDSKYSDSSPRLAVAPATWTGFLTYAAR